MDHFSRTPERPGTNKAISVVDFAHPPKTLVSST